MGLVMKFSRKAAAASLLGGMCAMQAAAAGQPARQPGAEEARILRVLDRMTFGPRPGELEAVEKAGLRPWLTRQLHPGLISDAALDARLAQFPAMALPQAELMERFPSRRMLREEAKGKRALPGDPLEHAVSADAVAFEVEARARREAAAADGTALGSGPGSGPGSRLGKLVDGAADAPPLAGPNSDPELTAQDGEVSFSEPEARAILALAPEARLRAMLALQPARFMALRASLGRAELTRLAEGFTPAQRETLAALRDPQRVVEDELIGSRLVRDVYSEREVEAVMTDFWLNHFNVFVHKNGFEPYLLPAYERDAIRPHALGKFEDLLAAVARSPAILVYLDNWQSTGPDSVAATRSGGRRKNTGLNENYARELLELHTLGARCEASADHPAAGLPGNCGGGYTQGDVSAVAEVLTGWTIEKPNEGAAFRFDPRRHEPGPQQVLGRTLAEDGQDQGLALLHTLAVSPATAWFVSAKLAQRFVSDTPPPALVNRMAKTWASTGGDIAAVLQTMLESKEFGASGKSGAADGAKLKTPEEFLLSAIRSSGANVVDGVPAAKALGRLGMPFYGMQTPNGYSWSAEPWANAGDLLNRLTLALQLSVGRLPGIAPDWPGALAADARLSLRQPAGGGGEGQERALETLLLGGPASERTRAAVLAPPPAEASSPAKATAVSLGAPASLPRAVDPEGQRVSGMAGLLLGSPEFQRR